MIPHSYYPLTLSSIFFLSSLNVREVDPDVFTGSSLKDYGLPVFGVEVSYDYGGKRLVHRILLSTWN